MAKQPIQKYIEGAMMIFCVIMLAFFIVRAHILPVVTGDWDYIRGPLAPIEYYQLGMLDEPIPSEEYLPYTQIPTPTPKKLENTNIPLSLEESVKDSTGSVENR